MGWDFAFSSPSARSIVRQIYVRWWEKYIVDTNEYPKMILDCNLLDPQTKSPFKLHSPHKSKKELKKQLQDPLSQISDDSDDDQEIQDSQNLNYFQDSQDPYEEIHSFKLWILSSSQVSRQISQVFLTRFKASRLFKLTSWQDMKKSLFSAQKQVSSFKQVASFKMFKFP